MYRIIFRSSYFKNWSISPDTDSSPAQVHVHREPFLDNENVYRLLRELTKDVKVGIHNFQLSSEDEKSPLKSLSVWAASLTIPVHARSFFPLDKQSEYTHSVLLNVSQIRLIRPTPDSTAVPSLNVVWDPIIDEETGQPETRAGAAGHAGIIGLTKVPGLENSDRYRKSLRSQLVDLANEVGPQPITS